MRAGDAFLILLPNSIFYPIILMGVLYLGAIVTAMNPRSNIPEIKKPCAECNVRFAFAESESVEKLQALGFPVVRVPENVDLDSKPVRFSSFYQLISCSLDSTKKPVINQQDTAAVLFSSGASKGIVLTHRNFIAMVELFLRFEASQYEYPSWNNVVLAIMPMFHIYGRCHFCLGLLSMGCSIVVMKSFDADEMVKAIERERERVTHITVVPPILRSLTNAAKHFNGSLQSLKQVCCGAAPVSQTEIDEFVRRLPHVDFIQNYRSAGLLAPTMEAKVVDYQTGSSLPPGDCGELCLRGPAVMKGYLNNPEATSSTIEPLHTGDVVYFDHDGYLYIVDRVKDMIKYKGFQIAPADLEAILISHPKILDAAVTGEPFFSGKDEECGEIPVAFVVGKPGSMLSRQDVIYYVAKQVGAHEKAHDSDVTQKILVGFHL